MGGAEGRGSAPLVAGAAAPPCDMGSSAPGWGYGPRTTLCPCCAATDTKPTVSCRVRIVYFSAVFCGVLYLYTPMLSTSDFYTSEK